jgi:hypothetical protein
VLLSFGPSQYVEYVFGDEGSTRCWHTQGEVGIFNPLKCYVLKIKKKMKTVDFDYDINGQTLETVASNPYLGAELTNTMSWDKQVLDHLNL